MMIATFVAAAMSLAAGSPLYAIAFGIFYLAYVIEGQQ